MGDLLIEIMAEVSPTVAGLITVVRGCFDNDDDDEDDDNDDGGLFEINQCASV